MNFTRYLCVNQQRNVGCLGSDAWEHEWSQKGKEEHSHSGVWDVQDEVWRKYMWCVEKIYIYSKSPPSPWQDFWQRGTQYQNFEELK